MCLAIPGRVTDLYLEHDVRMGKVDFGGVAKRICLEYVPEATVGDYVLVHVGFALARIDESEARQVFALFEQSSNLEELRGPHEVPG